MLRKISAVILVSVVVLTGCASQGWSPTVDPYGDPNAANIERDTVECRQLAKNAAGGVAKEAGKGTLIGGAIGAAAGAALGAAVGSPGTGAAIGAATGGFGGAAHRGFGAENDFKNAFKQCMTGRGHRVIN